MTSSRAEYELVVLAKLGNHAGQTALVKRHSGMVGKQAAKQAARNPRADYDDLFQAGCLGILHAAELFDVCRNVKFLTYATWWIKQCVQRESEDSGLIHVPNYILNGRGREKYRAAAARASHVGTLDLTDGEGNPLCDIPERPHEQSPFDDDERALLRQAIATLDRRSHRLARLRFFNGLTLKEVGEHLGVTRERIRQMEGKIIKRLRETIEAKREEGRAAHARPRRA